MNGIENGEGIKVSCDSHKYVEGKRQTEINLTDGTGNYYEMPVTATIFLTAAAKNTADQSIAYWVQLEPSSESFLNYDGEHHMVGTSNSFPPEGPHEILKDGSYNPANLPELVQEFINRHGYCMSTEDMAKFGLLPV